MSQGARARDDGLTAVIERGRELARGYEKHAGFVGAYLYGSSTRPYADASSDLDLAVVVEDEALARIPPSEIHTNITEGGRKVGDVWFQSRSEHAGPALRDIDRHNAAHARVLVDPGGTLSTMLGKRAEMTEEVRDVRLKVHYYELTRLAQKVHNAQHRGRSAAMRLLGAQLVLTISKILFIERSAWPAPMSWVFEELEVVGIPSTLVAKLRDVVENPDARAVRALRGLLDAYLLEKGVRFMDDPVALWNWLFHTPEGMAAQIEWGGEIVRTG